jgi:hypothetical protein
MKQTKTHTLGIRVDNATYERLQRLALATERSMGSVVRLLIRQAEVSGFREICLLPRHQADYGVRAREPGGQEVNDG